MEGRDDATLQIIRKMGRLSRLHSRLAEGGSEEPGLYRSQMMVLAWLERCEGPVSQKNIADRFEISKPAATGLISRLEDMGMVERSVSSEDQRVKLVRITERGHEFTERKRGSFRELNARMAEGIGKADMEAFSRVLDVMIANLKDMEGSRQN